MREGVKLGDLRGSFEGEEVNVPVSLPPPSQWETLNQHQAFVHKRLLKEALEQHPHDRLSQPSVEVFPSNDWWHSQEIQAAEELACSEDPSETQRSGVVMSRRWSFGSHEKSTDEECPHRMSES
jgi:hypothetical protein